MTTEALSAAPPPPPPPPTVMDVDRSPSITHAPSVAATTTSKSAKSLSASPGKNYSPPKKVASAPSEDSARSPDLKRNELPKIIVKKEPTSPGPPSRHRPAKLNLSNAPNTSSGAATPRTANGNLATIQDVGMACLSPGFSTQDPTMREQLQRSISVREAQRSIIESRLHRHAKPNAEPNSRADRDEPPASARDRSDRGSDRSAHTPRRRPPNSLTIVPPSHRAFAHERVVQSAPLHQSFTGRHHPPPPSHHNSQQHPQNQEVNRLPPITDVVFGPNRLDSARGIRPQEESSSRQYYPTTRPAYPSPNNMAYPRPREHRSAEEAIANMSGGREELLPRIIHYGGHQPPTPPSPPQAPAHTPSKLMVNGVQEHPPHSSGTKRRRTREDYGERDGSFGSEDSPDAKRRKKEEFLSLCARAWELFHS
ncbi:uncharacterized protein H6S33_012425 [Morchella sextelata]|uniref:uncharacterized protein n=1 Tax=Morchella sextelata TaxID=1174677 RepID=UPI001D044045|nr:uncharacterized protein H6S33_012425 [Morchella sextelata]KAH0609879.1 hypothetical protein H6S33_012425 [Morchella sextelata]